MRMRRRNRTVIRSQLCYVRNKWFPFDRFKCDFLTEHQLVTLTFIPKRSSRTNGNQRYRNQRYKNWLKERKGFSVHRSDIIQMIFIKFQNSSKFLGETLSLEKGISRIQKKCQFKNIYSFESHSDRSNPSISAICSLVASWTVDNLSQDVWYSE